MTTPPEFAPSCSEVKDQTPKALPNIGTALLSELLRLQSLRSFSTSGLLLGKGPGTLPSLRVLDTGYQMEKKLLRAHCKRFDEKWSRTDRDTTPVSALHMICVWETVSSASQTS
ncbi:uncharacterized protein EI90DRAFT_3114572 [Cantharellus anzutake]|uniref:uncharacterized protein n=1 Tax=Cantharellus anzutake TaxID=1750568 RepID=UPI001906D0AD|nr:uncharacterized protein EI90DRAFT_3114572 [Cantharellus anzutake]KAF8343923.1 hypothetical protein EI90DRAFT_3114572 [Cantharellus anzutake]